MTTDVARGEAAGFAAYVTKPIDFARLPALMDEATRTAKRH
jgi:CheY-like chemotaxis protein